MNDRLLTEYRRQRRANPYYPAQTCLGIARVTEAGRGFWNDHPTADEDRNALAAAEWTDDGFTFRAVLVNDDDRDTSWLGDFTDDPTDAVPNPNYGGPSWANYSDSKWFRPERGGESYAEQYAYLRRTMSANGARAEMRRYAEQDAATAAGEWFGVIVTASIDGTEWGEASLWGMSDEHPYAYCAEEAREVAREAAHEASAAIGRAVEKLAHALGTVGAVLA